MRRAEEHVQESGVTLVGKGIKRGEAPLTISFLLLLQKSAISSIACYGFMNELSD